MLGCLREQVEELGPACKEEVFKRQVEAANDWRTDKELKDACEVPPCPSFPSSAPPFALHAAAAVI